METGKNIGIEIGEEERKQNLSIPAKRLMEKLQPLKSKEEQTAKRWFWELLQNASDYNDTVSVRLEVDDHCVKFSHNGKPFSIADAFNIISPDSGKDSDEVQKNNIGKFGSGLVSTHILSAEITATGTFVSNDSEDYYNFCIHLDRSKYTSKDALIQAIERQKQEFKDSPKLISKKDYSGYMTTFSYDTDRRLPGLSPTKDVVSVGMKQIYDVLPYTLTFMDKVERVDITDSRCNSEIRQYSIFRKSLTGNQIVYEIQKDGTVQYRTFVKQSYKRAETTYEIENNAVKAYPENMARLFCGLPMIGSEKNGHPILINSFAFEPTIEREGVEITPNDTVNLSVFREAVELYRQVLTEIANHHWTDAYNLASLSREYNGLEPSGNVFRRDYMPEFQKSIEKATIVENAAGDWIPVSSMRIPVIEGKASEDLYNCASEIRHNCLPSHSSYKGWLNAIDFRLFNNLKYTLESLAQDIQKLQLLQSISLRSNTDVRQWLHNVLSLLAKEDERLLSQYAIIPNQKGKLCALQNIYVDEDIPAQIKDIHNQLTGNAIEDELLDTAFNDFTTIVEKKKTMDDVTRVIDRAIRDKYSASNGSVVEFVSPLNKLYSWVKTSTLSDKRLEELFPWFYTKRATLFLDTFTDNERDYAFTIIQSGKMKALATLAESNISANELEYLSQHPEMVSRIYGLIQGEIDDKGNANSDTGNFGEQLVYEDLKKKYKLTNGFTVDWVAKEGETRYDFVVKYKGTIKLYVDAKTTMRGISNSDSVPFFMRMSQWEFLPTIGKDEKYLIARVFKQGEIIKYLYIHAME